jgi:hypothetical protein
MRVAPTAGDVWRTFNPSRLADAIDLCLVVKQKEPGQFDFRQACVLLNNTTNRTVGSAERYRPSGGEGIPNLGKSMEHPTGLLISDSLFLFARLTIRNDFPSQEL